jgi:HEPN domain-containing protein
MSMPTLKQNVDYWRKGSAEAMRTMRTLLSKKNSTYAMFFGHLALEKILKAVCAVRRIPIPTAGAKGHDLVYIAGKCGLVLTAQQIIELTTIKAFNIEARYDDYKQRFHALCTPQYVKTWVAVITSWYKDLKTIVINERTFLPNNCY